MPGAATEAVPDEEGADADGDGEGDEGADRADAEDRADGDVAGEDQEHAGTADGDVEPDCVYGRLGVGIYSRPEPTEWETAVSGVGEGDTAGGDHAALAHAECGDDGE